MDVTLLRSWLGLPPGDWPPEPLSLLGTENPQERALALMERLRPHQLRHPELVTEGMNRLAQALIVAEKLEAPKPVEMIVELEPDTIPPPAFEFNLSLPQPAPAIPAVIPIVLEAEVVEASGVKASARLKPDLQRPRKRKKRRRAPADRVAIPEVPAQPTAEVTNRRLAYRELVTLQRAVTAWEKLGPFFGVPSQELITSADVFRYLEATAECRKALRGFDLRPLLSQILRSPIALFRDLQKSQRDTLASDWALTLAKLQSESRSRREALRASKPRSTWAKRWKATRRQLAVHPEWMLVASLLIAALIAVIRTVKSSS